MFEELSNDTGLIRINTLKAYLLEIGEEEELAVRMISLLDSNCNGTVKYKDFENFLINRILPNKEDS
jgi:Ca2+-binding EF-hand superfamily protein